MRLRQIDVARQKCVGLVLGVIVGIVIALCGYKPYQIEMEYRHNIATGPNARMHKGLSIASPVWTLLAAWPN
jgi:hypothetical protein